MSHLWHFGVNKLYQIFNPFTGNRVYYCGRAGKEVLQLWQVAPLYPVCEQLQWKVLQDWLHFPPCSQ